MINPNKPLFKWGPIDGKPFYVDVFTEAFTKFPKYYEGTWPDCLGHCSKNKVTFILDDESIRKNGLDLFKKYVLDDKKLVTVFNSWEETVNILRAFEELSNHGFSKYDEIRLRKLFDEWDKVHMNFWIHGFIPELSNVGGEKILKEKIESDYKGNFIEIFESLSAPDKMSFHQAEELSLLNIKLAHPKSVNIMLNEHQRKYYWKMNSYSHTEVLEIDDFKDELNQITVEEAKKKVEEINSYADNVKKRKKDIINKFNIDEETQKIAERLAYCVWWQDHRKQFIFIANHINTLFLEEISKRKDIPFEDLLLYTIPEMKNLLQYENQLNVEERRENLMLYYKEGKDTIEIIEGEKAKTFSKPFINLDFDKSQTELKGLVVSKGPTIKAKAKIVLSPKDMDNFNEGDILISPMTSPDFITIMRKSSAIITDEGGMTSHAAIVSRELKTPCIVGTKIATKLFKDDQLLVIDTETGIIKVLK